MSNSSYATIVQKCFEMRAILQSAHFIPFKDYSSIFVHSLN